MVRPICKDEMFLSQKAKPAEESDLPVAGDLLETLMAHHEECKHGRQYDRRESVHHRLPGWGGLYRDAEP